MRVGLLTSLRRALSLQYTISVRSLSRMAEEGEVTRDSVKEYYGKILKTTTDLQTPACCSLTGVKSKSIKEALSLIHTEVSSKFYGCGLVIPEKLQAAAVLDLGSGSGQDCFAISKLVGPQGRVTGIDMTDEQLDVARKYIDYHTEKFGYSQPNVDFVKGYIEKLTEAGLKENNFNIIVSNCVVNLSPDKHAVLTGANKVLKVGGELYFSDVYTDSDLPETARKHEVLWGECISGALMVKELFSLAKELGFSVPRMVEASPIPIEREDFKKVLGDAKFASVTYRLFKLPETREEATQVIYNGDIPEHEQELQFDHRTVFKTGDVIDVNEELATILKCSRFSDEFEFRPPSKKSAGGCQKSASVDVDPFEYLENQKSKGDNPAAPSCCPGGAKTKCC